MKRRKASNVRKSKKKARKPKEIMWVNGGHINCAKILDDNDGLAIWADSIKNRGAEIYTVTQARRLINWLTRYIAWAKQERRK